METIQHGFIKGMNRDVSKSKFPRDAYYYLLNGRVLPDDTSTLSDIINIKGNTNANINNNGLVRTSYSIIGYVNILNDIILFYAENTATGSDSDTTYSIIDRLIYTGDNTYSRSEIWIGQGLNFRIDKPIRAVSRYESNIVEKIYWTDNNNCLKQLNLAEDVSSFTANQFDIIGNLINTFAPTFSDYTSGSLKQGSICYAYRLIKQNGIKTVFSDVSEIIPLGLNIYSYQDIRRLYGDPIYDPDSSYNTGKGVIINININNTDYLDEYDFMEVISLWYSSDYATPDINIISKIELQTGISDYRIADVGTNSYGSITYAEFTNLNYDFIAKDITSKDNRLFVANIQEEYFDLDQEATWSGKSPGDLWDSRAYRFDSTGRAELLDSTLSIEYTLTNPSQYDTVDYEADAINKYNYIRNTPVWEWNSLGNEQRFQSDGTTEGGSGLNITYSFTYVNVELALATDDDPVLDGPISADKEYILGLYKGFQRDEVYRFGIVFFDKKGRQTFVKWIGDIRMPKISSTNDLADYTGSISAEGYYLHPVFTISNCPSIDGEYLDWQIVYVKREKEDKSIVASGMLQPTTEESANVYRVSTKPHNIGEYNTGSSTNYTLNKTLVNFISPEFCFREKESWDIDFIHTVGDISASACVTKDRSDPTSSWSIETCNDEVYTQDYVVYVRKYLKCTLPADPFRVLVIDSVKTIPPTALNFTVNIASSSYKHVSYLDIVTSTSAAHGTCLTCKIADVLTATPASPYYFYAYGRKVVFESQYGGLSYTTRQNNSYIAASPKQSGTTSSVTCKYGDTFVTIFEYGKFFMKYPDESLQASKGYSDFNYITCESSINCLLRTNDTYSRTYLLDPIIPGYINEDPYVDLDTGLTLDKLYGYNSAYNKLEDSKKFFAKPQLFQEVSYQGTRVKYSDVKIENEDIDSWLIFRANNYNEANDNYGPINKLINFQDKVFSFQDTAVSLISINPRVSQQSQDGVNIILGSGETIDKFHYLTNDIGCQDNSDIIKSLSTIYWLDKNKKKIYSFDGKLESVTDLKGMFSYFKNNIYENSYFKGVYDSKNSEVIFTITDDNPNVLFQASEIGGGIWHLIGNPSTIEVPFVTNRIYQIGSGFFIYNSKSSTYYRFTYSHGTTLTNGVNYDLSNYITEKDNFTICYSEKLQSFTSFYSFLPTLYINSPRDYFTTTNNRDLYQHNIGEAYNTFFGVTYPTTLKFITNFGSQIQSEYTNIKFFAEIENELGELISNETLTNISLKDSEQISSDIILYPIHLPEAIDRDRHVLDTSSIRLGVDWYSGLSTPPEGLVVYNNELYRNISLSNQLGPPSIGVNWSRAELCNIRKTNKHWITQLPRVLYDENGLSDPNYIMSNRFRSDWLEITLEFKDVLPGINLYDRRIKLSDIKIISSPIIF